MRIPDWRQLEVSNTWRTPSPWISSRQGNRRRSPSVFLESTQVRDTLQEGCYMSGRDVPSRTQGAATRSTAPQAAGRAVNVYADDDLRYWATRWDISLEELRRAIAKVGPQTETLARYFSKPL